MKKLTKEEELTQQTYNKLAVNWSSTHSTKSFWYEEMQLFYKFLPRGKILEIGSGAGRDAQELLGYGYKYVGTDYSGPLLQQARHSNPGVVFKELSIYDLDFQERFDGFWCAAVLLHIPKARIQEALKAVAKNLKQNAIGFISTKEGKGEGIETRHGIKGYDRLISYWQKEDFKIILKETGMEVVYEGFKPYEDSVWLTYIVRLVGQGAI